ncbi:MAG: hypothetical protein ACR2LV_11540 [Solirubrobacteraceae bacterium]
MSAAQRQRQRARQRRRAGVLSLLGLIVVVAVIVALRSSGAGPAGPARFGGAGSGERGGRGSGHGLESIFEATPQLLADPVKTLDTLRRLGADRIRLFVAWGALAPDAASRSRPRHFDAADPAAYPPASWASYDTIVRNATARGIGVDLDLTAPPPAWASRPGAPHPRTQPQWKPSSPEFGLFVRAVATRYSGRYTPPGASKPLPRVDFWSIWNEPNYGPDLAPQAIDHSTVEVSPALYRGLVRVAWAALQGTGHGHDTILIGELAPRGQTIGDSPGNFGGMVPLRFLRALYCADGANRPLRGAAAVLRGCPSTAGASARFASENPGLFHAGGFAAHPYPQAQPPNALTPGEPDYADLPALPKLERTLDTLQRAYGSSTRFDLYSTEYGYRTDPPERGFATPDQAAYYINWGEYLSWRDPRVRSYDQYLLIDPPTSPSRAPFESGLQFASGVRKPSYDAYRMPLYLPRTTSTPGQPLEVWGCVRPARFVHLDTGKRQAVRLEFQPHGRGAFEPMRIVRLTDPYGYFDVREAFATSGTLRLRWSYPGGPTISSRTVAITIG